MTFLFKQPYLRKALVYLLLGNFLLGISYIAMLPIWEGFDETAHFSYLQQLADNRKLPLDGKDKISTDIEKYYDFAPVPEALSTQLTSKDRLTYQSFFSKSADFLSRSERFIHSPHEKPRSYMPGRGYNWQSQHPPLYYILLSPAYLMTSSLSWADQIFILRMISYIFAWIGLGIIVFGCLEMAQNQQSQEKTQVWHWAALGTGLWPVLFPAWFSDMARLGNDSICCFLLSLIWLVSIRMIQRGVTLKYFLILGFLLGLGCQTKAFFIPITVGVLGFWLYREGRLRGRDGVRQMICLSSLAFLIILFLNGWWLWSNFIQHGIFLGSDEVILLKQAGGLGQNLESNFSFNQWARRHYNILVTFGWTSSWSSVNPYWLFRLLISLGVLFVMAGYLWAIRRREMVSAEWLPFWMIILVLIGLSYHVLIRIALTGGGTGGYYLHILAGPMSTALGLSLYEIWARPFLRILIQVLLSYVILFSMAITWAQSLFFSGVVGASENERIFSFPEQLPPFFGIIEAYQRLKIIVFPETGFLIFVCGWVLVLLGLVFARRFANT